MRHYLRIETDLFHFAATGAMTFLIVPNVARHCYALGDQVDLLEGVGEELTGRVVPLQLVSRWTGPGIEAGYGAFGIQVVGEPRVEITHLEHLSRKVMGEA
jgi:hypothetical protein